MRIIVYTDGSCKHLKKLGGWGAVVKIGQVVYELGGAERTQSSNKMEMIAVVKALKNIPFRLKGSIVIYTDSRYIIHGVKDAAWKWSKWGWKRTDGKFICNMYLWKELLDLVKRHSLNKQIQWTYIKSHSGNPGNERADLIAGSFSREIKIKLYIGDVDSYLVPL